MLLYTIKISTVVISLVLVNMLIKRDLPLLGAFLVAMPLSSLLTILWMYADKKSPVEIGLFTQNVGFYVLPSLAFFFLFPFFLKKGVSFSASLMLSIFLNGSIFIVYKLALQKFGIKI